MLTSRDLRGVTVAIILPFDRSGAIDWDGYARVLDCCAVPNNVASVLVNGHAGEATSLSAQERANVIGFARKAIGTGKLLLIGVIPHGVADAIEQAKAAKEAGADAYVFFPPPLLGAASTDAPHVFIEAVTAAVDIPTSSFRWHLTSAIRPARYATSPPRRESSRSRKAA
jgi:4-hydroxy-tetrahydrodipicolinate synthase